MTQNIEPKVLQILLTEATSHVQQLLDHQLPGAMVFHNFTKVEEDVRNLQLLLDKITLPDKVQFELLYAMTFRLSGYIESYNGYLTHSKKIAQDFLTNHNYPEEGIRNVLNLIDASEQHYQAASFVEQIMQDAITAYYGQKKYKSKQILNFEESNHFNKKQTNLNNWLEIRLSYLKKHRFYTKEAMDLFQSRKKKNIQKLRKAIKKIHKQKKSNSFSTDSAARMMFKTALRNHVDLTNIGDQKANIMLSINAIILTIGIPLFAKYSSNMLYLIIPALIFMITCVTTMVFAALATRPVKMRGEIDMAKLNAGKTDLFFFGNFFGIKQDTYHQLIRRILDDRKLLDDNIINHLYFMGDSLGQKFVYLRRCYTIFIAGFILTVLSFILSFIFTT